jgi:hypothetical protein
MTEFNSSIEYDVANLLMKNYIKNAVHDLIIILMNLRSFRAFHIENFVFVLGDN